VDGEDILGATSEEQKLNPIANGRSIRDRKENKPLRIVGSSAEHTTIIAEDAQRET